MIDERLIGDFVHSRSCVAPQALYCRSCFIEMHVLIQEPVWATGIGWQRLRWLCREVPGVKCQDEVRSVSFKNG